MNIVFFTHPDFLGHQSMPRYANWLAGGMKERGHHVDLWSARPFFSRLAVKNGTLKKWLGYLDQYLVFPIQARKRLKALAPDTLFVFTDHALGPWVPLVADRPHVVHCHDFLAQRSAMGEFAENVTGKTGKIYQSYIRKGYNSGRNFISISNKTKVDLQRMLDRSPLVSEVVYNGLTRRFAPSADLKALRRELSSMTGIDLNAGFILHVGGNLWYKNRRGVVEAYGAWRRKSDGQLPLLLIGEAPDAALSELIECSGYRGDIYPMAGMSDDFANKAYSAASLFLFPSIAEGFGWPIAEAMASGCPVITTDEAPMNEVAGQAAFYVRRMQVNDSVAWAEECSLAINHVLNLPEDQRALVVKSGLQNISRFDSAPALDQIEAIYRQVLGVSRRVSSPAGAAF